MISESVRIKKKVVNAPRNEVAATPKGKLMRSINSPILGEMIMVKIPAGKYMIMTRVAFA